MWVSSDPVFESEVTEAHSGQHTYSRPHGGHCWNQEENCATCPTLLPTTSTWQNTRVWLRTEDTAPLTDKHGGSCKYGVPAGADREAILCQGVRTEFGVLSGKMIEVFTEGGWWLIWFIVLCVKSLYYFSHSESCWIENKSMEIKPGYFSFRTLLTWSSSYFPLLWGYRISVTSILKFDVKYFSPKGLQWS